MTKNNAMLGMGVAAWMAAAAAFGQAVELARWNSSGATPQAESFAPVAANANAVVANLSRGPGLGTGGSPGGNTFWATGFNDSTSGSSAMSNGDYWQTSFTPAAGKSLSFSEVKFRFRATSTGPQQAQWAYSLNGSTFVWIGEAFTPASVYTTESDINLSGVAGLQNCEGQVWFRLAGWNSTSATGPGGFGQNTDVLSFAGTVGTAGPILPTVSFSPSGNQSVAVSNELTLAVSATPAGSGISSWSLTPTFAGSASLSGGSFVCIPVAGDANKTFTLAVAATNAAGSSTGTVSIAVTSYVPPVPVVTFHPAGPYALMATHTQRLGVAVSPSGSAIQSWTLTPEYAGTASLVGTNFTFVPAVADGPGTYSLAVVATNVHGVRTGTASIAVSLYVPPPPAGAYFIDFEADTKGSFASAVVNVGGKPWELAEALIGSTTSEKMFGGKAVRIRHTDALPVGMTSQNKLLTNGVGTISFWYAYYGSDGEGSPVIALDLSESLASGWMEVASFDTSTAEQLTYASVNVRVGVPVHVRFRSKSGGAGKRANLDNIAIVDYAATAPSSYEGYLLSYNVTPGDPGTEPGDDLDGDGYTNWAEFQAGSNPYDPASTP